VALAGVRAYDGILTSPLPLVVQQTRCRRARARYLSALLLASSACGSSSDGEPTPGSTSTTGATSTQAESTASTTTGSSSTVDATSTSEPASTGESTSSVDTGSSSDSAGETSYPQPCADLYDQAIVPTFELTFTPDELANVQADCQNGERHYRPMQLTYDGEVIDAMARLKGNWSWNCQKLQFVVSFNEVDPDARFHGVRKLVFDAPWYDHSLLHERIAFPLFRERGLPYSCVNNARVVVNGEYQGLFANVERLDKEYLQRHFDEADGNLYEGGVELETNETIADTSDIEALNAANTIEELDALIDLDEAVAEWATEAMLPAMDNYWAGVEINYYLYNHPSRGFLYLPVDLDITFGDASYPGGELIWPDSVTSDPITYQHPGWLKEGLFQRVLADPQWCARFVEELELSRAAYSPQELSARVDEASAQIAASVEDDPNRPFSMNEHDAAVASMKDFFVARAQFVDDWLAQGNHCPAEFP